MVGAGPTLAGAGRYAVASGNLQAPFLVRGKYVEFTVVPASFAVRDYTFTGAANPLDQTGGVRTVLFAGKTPDHRGLILSGNAQVELKDTDIRPMRVDVESKEEELPPGASAVLRLRLHLPEELRKGRDYVRSISFMHARLFVALTCDGSAASTKRRPV